MVTQTSPAHSLGIPIISGEVSVGHSMDGTKVPKNSRQQSAFSRQFSVARETRQDA
jgi:hypothetical protein